MKTLGDRVEIEKERQRRETERVLQVVILSLRCVHRSTRETDRQRDEYAPYILVHEYARYYSCPYACMLACYVMRVPLVRIQEQKAQVDRIGDLACLVVM